MPSDPWELPAAVLAIVALVGVLYRYVVLPQIKRDLIVPMQETHEQVTRNGHSHKTRTLVDRLADLEVAVAEGNAETTALRGETAEMRGETAELRKELTDHVVRFGYHLSATEEEKRRIWAELRRRPRDPNDP